MRRKTIITTRGTAGRLLGAPRMFYWMVGVEVPKERPALDGASLALDKLETPGGANALCLIGISRAASIGIANKQPVCKPATIITV